MLINKIYSVSKYVYLTPFFQTLNNNSTGANSGVLTELSTTFSL